VRRLLLHILLIWISLRHQFTLAYRKWDVYSKDVYALIVADMTKAVDGLTTSRRCLNKSVANGILAQV
jgi:hypothetical protein